MLIRIGTRRSPLALAQTHYVMGLIKLHNPDVKFSLHMINTIADRDRVSEFYQFGIVGVFSTEHEDQLISRQVDIVVHSLKDLPTILADGLVLAAVPDRKDPRDMLCGTRLADLGEGSTIGTGSLRRKAQILRLRPDVVVVPIRGNIGSRLDRINGETALDAIILAQAGLERLDIKRERMEILSAGLFPYAVGQGALGVQARGDDFRILDIVTKIQCKKARAEVDAERAMLHTLGAGCSLPVGVSTMWQNDQLSLSGQVTSLNGDQFVTCQKSMPASQATQLGIHAAEQLRDKGGVDILESSYKSFCSHYKFISA